MKVTVISDTHTLHKQIPVKYLTDGDMIIHCGDVSSMGYKQEIINFLDWFNTLPFSHKIFIPGNHDFFFEKAPEKEIKELLDKYPDITYLHDSGIEIEGFKIWGSGITPWFHSWAFNRVGEEICKHWDLIPLDSHILVTHGPVRGYLDMTLEGDLTGCPYLKETISKMTNLSMHCWGHIHEAYGHYMFENGSAFINASVLNRSYKMTNKPYIITLDDITKKIITIEQSI